MPAEGAFTGPHKEHRKIMEMSTRQHVNPYVDPKYTSTILPTGESHRALCWVSCSPVSIFQVLIFKQGILVFIWRRGPTNYALGPASLPPSAFLCLRFLFPSSTLLFLSPPLFYFSLFLFPSLVSFHSFKPVFKYVWPCKPPKHRCNCVSPKDTETLTSATWECDLT